MKGRHATSSRRIGMVLRQAQPRETQLMFAIIGILVVIGAVLGGFLMEKGPVLVLVQPSEFIIIGGAALGKIGRAHV